MNRWSAWALLLAIAAALALRLPKLDTRPLHNDEAVNAFKVSELWQDGRYVYDPDEYHGPTLHYATLPFLWLGSARNSDELTNTTLRLGSVVFGVGLVLLVWLFKDALGGKAVAWAAVFTAISPAMVFYSRYFIHEMLLVFFTALTLGAGIKYVQTRNIRWAILAGAGLGLMSATKETFVITFAAMTLASLLTIVWRVPAGARKDAIRSVWNRKHAIVALSVASITWFLLFTSFFANLDGPLDSIRTYLPWLKRAGGHSPHIHPWNFYLERLAWFHPAKGPIWSEGLVLILAGVGMAASLRARSSPLHCFLALYTLILTAVYSAISYKTPWCLLSFYHGMILLAGIGAAAMVDCFTKRAARNAVVMILLAAISQLAWQARRASFIFAADPRNPYVYAQTVPDILNLVNRIEGLARIAPSGYDTVVKVIAPENDYWPLPWHLRRFKHVGWYPKMPDDPFAPVIAVSSKFDAQLDEKSGRKWIMAGLSELRPRNFFELYVELELWKKYVETLPREAE